MCTNMLDSMRWSTGCLQPIILRRKSESPTFSMRRLSLSPRLVTRIPLHDALVTGFILWRSQAGTLPTLSLWGQRPCHAQKALFSSNLPQPMALKSLCFFFHGGSWVLVWRVGDYRYPIIYGWALHFDQLWVSLLTTIRCTKKAYRMGDENCTSLVIRQNLWLVVIIFLLVKHWHKGNFIVVT